MLHLPDYCSQERIHFLTTATKDTALGELVDVLATDPRAGERQKLLDAILARDEIVSTGIGFGIAIPHCRIDSVKRLCMSLGISAGGIDYPSIDDKPVRIVMMIAASAADQNLYLRVLSKVMAFLKKERDPLLRCKSQAEAYELLKKY